MAVNLKKPHHTHRSFLLALCCKYRSDKNTDKAILLWDEKRASCCAALPTCSLGVGDRRLGKSGVFSQPSFSPASQRRARDKKVANLFADEVSNIVSEPQRRCNAVRSKPSDSYGPAMINLRSAVATGEVLRQWHAMQYKKDKPCPVSANFTPDTPRGKPAGKRV